jgi:ribosomal protein S18 acetylase RimI-like enzyme
MIHDLSQLLRQIKNYNHPIQEYKESRRILILMLTHYIQQGADDKSLKIPITAVLDEKTMTRQMQVKRRFADSANPRDVLNFRIGKSNMRLSDYNFYHQRMLGADVALEKTDISVPRTITLGHLLSHLDPNIDHIDNTGAVSKGHAILDFVNLIAVREVDEVELNIFKTLVKHIYFNLFSKDFTLQKTAETTQYENESKTERVVRESFLFVYVLELFGAIINDPTLDNIIKRVVLRFRKLIESIDFEPADFYSLDFSGFITSLVKSVEAGGDYTDREISKIHEAISVFASLNPIWLPIHDLIKEHGQNIPANNYLSVFQEHLRDSFVEYTHGLPSKILIPSVKDSDRIAQVTLDSFIHAHSGNRTELKPDDVKAKHTVDGLSEKIKTRFSGHFSLSPQLVLTNSDGTIIGYIRAQYRSSRFEIMNLFIDPLDIRRGYGTKLMNKMLCMIGCYEVNVRVSSLDVASMKFYQKLGFVKTNEAVPPLKFGDKCIPVLNMVREADLV